MMFLVLVSLFIHFAPYFTLKKCSSLRIPVLVDAIILLCLCSIALVCNLSLKLY
jgi:hypothetical protein